MATLFEAGASPLNVLADEIEPPPVVSVPSVKVNVELAVTLKVFAINVGLFVAVASAVLLVYCCSIVSNPTPPSLSLPTWNTPVAVEFVTATTPVCR